MKKAIFTCLLLFMFCLSGYSQSAKAGDDLKTQLLEGIKLVNQRKNEKAIPYLEKYLKGMNQYMKDNPSPKDATAKKSFEKNYMKGVAYLRHAYIQTDNPEGAVKVVENTAILKKWVGPKSEILDAATPAENILLISQTKLDAAEVMKAQEKEGWEPVVNRAIKALEMINGNLAWRSMACVEKTRALCLLGRYEEGLKELNKYMAAIIRMDRGYKNAGMLHSAPSTKAYLWKGKLLVGMAEKAETDEDKAKHYLDAGKCFYRVINYGDKCPYFNKATSAYNDVSKTFKEVSKGKTLPKFEIEAPPPHQKKRVEIGSNLNEKGEKIGKFIEIDFLVKRDDNDEDTEENKKWASDADWDDQIKKTGTNVTLKLKSKNTPDFLSCLIFTLINSNPDFGEIGIYDEKKGILTFSNVEHEPRRKYMTVSKY